MVNVAGNQVEFMETGRRPVVPLAGLPTAATAPSRNKKALRVFHRRAF
jgi:hypothetical protein